MFATKSLALAVCIAAAAAPTAAQADILRFHVALDGKYGSDPSGAPGTGEARVLIDTATHKVSVDLDVTGITIDDLSDNLTQSPVGPIHFHKYATAAGGDSVLALPLPFGPDYQSTSGGLRVALKDEDYDAGAALVKSTLSFDDFLAGMKTGLIVLNIHTDRFEAGEISGLVVPG